ncbi:putative membrane protein [Halopseudomonas xinjiangensis]|uniref:Putative membrane protein n=1 Tax=Halopseudomonas xinjiangensis TaxID=487184 RepID=A0A1H1TX77_9GAMM|nr:cytochrome c oxidase assembly protein [Halopseudomonas xinjiangensis]SDS64802.1 putative membrane protein [Halopseudomonas xinjiangensis]
MTGRAVIGLAGLGVLALCWLGPLPELANQSFSAHMLMHVLVIALAAPLIAVGLAATGFDIGSRIPWLGSPVLASLIELVVVWAWHTPRLHHLARMHDSLMVAEQLSYLLVGLLIWLSAFGGPKQDSTRIAAGVAGLLLTSMHMTLLGVLLATADRALFAHTASPWFGLSVLQDQQTGGVIMLVFGGVAYLVGALYLLTRLLKDEGHATQLP